MSEPSQPTGPPVPPAPIAEGQEEAPTGKAIPQGDPDPTSPAPPIKAKKRKKKKKAKETGLGTSRGIETMFRTSYRTHIDLSALADAKANIMISINGIIMSIILASISPKIDTNGWLLLPTSLMLIFCLISMIYAILAARPRVSSNLISLDDVRQDRANILFFGNFVNLSADEFILGMEELLQDNTRLYHNMMRDIYGLGAVLQTKFKLLRTAYTIFMIGLVVSIMVFLIVYVLVVFGTLGST